MVTRETRYSLDSVKQDVMSFFTNDNHQAYQYGSKAISCGKDSVFYKKQIQVIFEDEYPHDVTGKAVNELIEGKFLKAEPRAFGRNMHVIFVYRHNVRYTAMAIKMKTKILERFSADEVNDGVGKYAEILFGHMFKINQFKIIDRNINTFRGKVWTKSDKDLDFIIEKDGISYGVEIKNRFDYMKQDEFEEKLEMCQFLGLLPVFPIRCPSEQQYAQMKDCDGLALKFKTRIFPPGFQGLVTDIWNNFRLPVNIWEEIRPPVEAVFLNYHHRNLLAQ
ncbi:unnamed protein product, partial [marine sediment metagenome]